MAPRAQGMDLMGAEYAKDAIRTAAAVLCGRVYSTILRITVLSRAEVACDGLHEQKGLGRLMSHAVTNRDRHGITDLYVACRP